MSSEGSFIIGPAFFKVLKGDFSDYLRIPPAFMKQTPMDLSKKAELKGPSGRIWHVGLSRRVNGLYLHDGWKKFVEDHFLEDSHFLLFRYHGNVHFTVHIFDKTACEINEIARFKTFQKSLPHRSKDKNSSSSTSGCRQQPIYPEYGDGMSCKSDHMLSSQLSGDTDSIQCLDKSKSEIHKCKNIETDDYKLSTSECKLVEDDSHTIEVQGQSSEMEETLQVFEKAIAFSEACKFPTFVKHFKKLVNKYTLRVPSKFCEEHMPNANKIVSLRDPNGRSWKVNFIRGGLLSRGWHAFLLANNLVRGDTCVFELVGEYQIQVHIYKG